MHGFGSDETMVDYCGFFFLAASLRPTGLDVGCPRGALTRIVVVLLAGGVYMHGCPAWMMLRFCHVM
jgi:hypothetical protein